MAGFLFDAIELVTERQTRLRKKRRREKRKCSESAGVQGITNACLFLEETNQALSLARNLPTRRPNVTVRPQAMPVTRFG